MDLKDFFLLLKKRMQNPNSDDSEHYKYVIYGFYDGLDVNCVKQWYKMRPKGLTELKSAVQLEDPFADQYTVQALFPQNIDELEKNFSYSLFQELEENKSNDQFAEYPLMAMTLINVSKDFVRKSKGLGALNALAMKFVGESLRKFK